MSSFTIPDFLLAQGQLTEEQRLILQTGDVANRLRKSDGWKLLLDWAEKRCNYSLARLKACQSNDPLIVMAIKNKWIDDEAWLVEVQQHVIHLADEYESIMEEMSQKEQGFAVDRTAGDEV